MIYTCSNCKQSYNVPEGQKMNNCPNCGNPFVSGATGFVDLSPAPPANCGRPFASGGMTTLSPNPFPFSGGWRRAVARLLDFELESLCFLPFFSVLLYYDFILLFDEPLLDAAIMGAISGVLAFMLDGAVFAMFGNTLGKFLFGVKVINTTRGTIISKEEYFKRNFLVFIQGFGLCIPVVNLIMACIQFQRVCSKKRRPATYDANPGYDVVLFKKSTVKSFFGIVLFSVLEVLRVVVNFALLTGK